MQSRIHRVLDERNSILKPDLTKYFVYLDTTYYKSVNEYANVDLIETEIEDKWKQIVQEEIQTRFKDENGPTWRMRIVKTNQKSGELDKLVFILTNNHAINDGRNGFSIMVQFLNILGALLENTTCEEMNGEVEHSPRSSEQLIEEYKAQVGFKTLPADQKPYYDHMTHRLSSKVADLNGAGGKFEFILIEHEKLDKLYKKLKQNAPECKINPLIAIIICKVLKKLYAKYEVDDVPLDSFQFMFLTGLRDRLKVKNTQMGFFSLTMACRIEDDLDGGDLWRVAEKFSESFHRRLQFNEDLPEAHALSAIYSMLESGFDFGQLVSTNFVISNLGVMHNTSNGVFRINEHYVTGPSVEKRMASGLNNGISTVANNLCWCVSYNEKYFSTQFIKDYKAGILGLVDELIL